MQLWALILILYFGAAFVMRDNFGEVFFRLEGAWWVALIALTLIGIAFAGPIRNFMSFMSEERHRMLYAVAALFCIGGVEMLNKEYSISLERNAQTAALAISPVETEIQRSWDGHFRAIAQVNGVDVGLLIDTGSSLVLLRHDDAERIGIHIDDLEYTTPLTTASGRSYVAPLIIDTLTIGDLTITSVKAAVAQKGALHSSLLGMTFLEHLDETVIRRDRLILRK